MTLSQLQPLREPAGGAVDLPDDAVDLIVVPPVRRRRAPVGPARLLSIVVPAYQEEERIGRTLDELADHLSDTGPTDVEVLVVAATRPDGSTDRTPDIVRDKRERFRHLSLLQPGPQVGKGRDVKVGMLAAKGQVRVFMDADLATPLRHLDRALDLVLNGHLAVIGVRDLTSSHRGLRRAISSLGNRLVQALLLPAIEDTQCGFKMFTGPVTEQVFGRQTISGWGFDMEVLAISRRLGHRITTLPIPDWTDVSGGTFSHAPVQGALRTLQDLLLIKWRTVTGLYRKAPALVPLTTVAAAVRSGAGTAGSPSPARHSAAPASEVWPAPVDRAP